AILRGIILVRSSGLILFIQVQKSFSPQRTLRSLRISLSFFSLRSLRILRLISSRRSRLKHYLFISNRNDTLPPALRQKDPTGDRLETAERSKKKFLQGRRNHGQVRHVPETIREDTL